MSVVDLRGVTARYGAFTALDDVSLALDAPATAIVGPNGAGKTTLFRVILGLHRPVAGVAQVLGADLRARRADVRRRIGFVPDGDATVPGATGVRMVAHLAEVSGLDAPTALLRAHEALDLVGLGEVRHRTVDTYSDGMRARLRIAQALAHRPELLIVDEPTSGLDPDARRVVLDLLRALRARGDVKILLSSQNLADVEELCDEVVFMNGGAVVARRTLAELRAGEQGLLRVVVRGARSADLAAALGEREVRLVDRRRLDLRGEPADVFRAAQTSGVELMELGPRPRTVEEVLLELVGAPTDRPQSAATAPALVDAPAPPAAPSPPPGRAPWSALLAFDSGLVLRRPVTLLVVALAFLAAMLQAGFFFAQTQGSLADESLLRAMGPRFFSKWLVGLLATQTILCTIVLAFGPAGLVSRDLRARAGDLYFSRPLTVPGYLLAKGGVAAFLSAIVLWVPLLVFYAYALLLGGEPGSPNWALVAPDVTLGRGAQLVALLTTITLVQVSIMLGISASTRSPLLAGLGFAAVFLLGIVLGDVLGRLPGLHLVRALSLRHMLEDVERALLGLGAADGAWRSAATLLALSAASLVFAARRVGRVGAA